MDSGFVTHKYNRCVGDFAGASVPLDCAEDMEKFYTSIDLYIALTYFSRVTTTY